MDDWLGIARDFRFYLKSTGKADQTVRTYVYAVGYFWRWCISHEVDARELDRGGVRHWITERQEEVSAQRAHNDLAAVRHFFIMLREDRLRDDDPTVGLRVKRTQQLPTEPVCDTDYEALLRACTNDRDRLIIMFMAYSGVRISEMASLTAETIDWQTGTIKVTGKGDKVRRIAPSAEVMGWLRSYLGMFPEGPLWRSHSPATMGHPLSAHQLRKIIYRIAEKAGLKDIHPHRLRSTMATNFMDQFGDVQALQGMMGHESIETTARYAEFTREKRGLEQMRRLNVGTG